MQKLTPEKNTVNLQKLVIMLTLYQTNEQKHDTLHKAENEKDEESENFAGRDWRLRL